MNNPRKILAFLIILSVFITPIVSTPGIGVNSSNDSLIDNQSTNFGTRNTCTKLDALISDDSVEIQSKNIVQFLLEKVGFLVFKDGTILTNETTVNGPKVTQKLTLLNKNETHEEKITILTGKTTESKIRPLGINSGNYTILSNSSPTKRSYEIIMGFSLVLLEYNFEIRWELKIFGWKIAYVYFGFEIFFGFRIFFPIDVEVTFPDTIPSGESREINTQIFAKDKQPCVFKEYDLGLVARFYAGVRFFGIGFDYSVGPNYRWTGDFITPLDPYTVDVITLLQIGILNFLSLILPAPWGTICGFIADWILDPTVKITAGFCSKKITASVKVRGEDVNIDGKPEILLEWNRHEDWENFTVHVGITHIGPIGLEFYDFRIYLDTLVFKVWFGFNFADWLNWLIPDVYWEVARIDVALPPYIPPIWVASTDRISIIIGVIYIPGVKIISISGPEQVAVVDKEYFETAEYFVTIKNEGTQFDTFDLKIEGIPPDWIVILPASVTLEGKEEMDVYFNITAARHWTTTAGLWTFKITATSKTDPYPAASRDGGIEILPYYDVQVFRVTPPKEEVGILEIKTESFGIAEFEVTNLGNSREEFALEIYNDKLSPVLEEEGITWYTITPTTVTLDPVRVQQLK